MIINVSNSKLYSHDRPGFACKGVILGFALLFCVFLSLSMMPGQVQQVPKKGSPTPSGGTAPGAPLSITATGGNVQVTLNWTVPTSDGGSAITNYTVYQGLITGTETLLAITGNVTTYTSTGLTNGQIYYFKIAAVNTNGAGDNTTEASATPRTVPSSPTLNTASPGVASVVLAWTAPVSNGGAPITGYNVYRATTSGGETLLVSLGAILTYTNTGLTNGQIYYYQVSAVNVAGEGARSTEVNATPAGVPTAPQSFTATPGSNEVILNWVAPASNGGSAIINYRIYVGTTSGGETLNVTVGVVLTYTVTNLQDGQNYYFQVSAVNTIGEGPRSVEISIPWGPTLSAPQALTATPGNAQIVLNWDTPASNGGFAITGYKVYRSLTSGTETLLISLGVVLTYTNVGLTNGQIYFYEVAAVNSQGVGPMSTEQSATPFTVPGAPTGLALTPGNTQVVLNWATPTSNGGSAITGYSVWLSKTSGTEALNVTIGNVLTYTVTGLNNGQIYYFKVAAINVAGTGALSAEASATPPTVPGAPTGLALTPSNTQIVLNWVAPASNGGSAITGYNVYRSLTTGTETLLINLGVVLTYTNVGLTNGQIYYYEVTAVNAMAESARSTEANATPRTIPWAPILNTAAPGNSQVVLAWTAPASNGGSAITGYNVYQGTTPGNETLLASLGAVLTYTSTGLTNGQIYYYKVSAVNAAGEGARSTELSATPATVPSAPLSLTEILENVQAFLNWAAPASNGGSAITGYKVYMGTTSGGETLLANLGVVLNYTATGLTNGQIYYFQVSAVNAFGEGARSTEVSALLSPMPGAPQSFAATAGAGQVTLNWAAPVYNSGFPIIGYVIYRGTVSNGETLIVTLGVVLTYTNTGLVNGQIYYYKVAAMNSQGTGPNATEVCATPLTVPGAPTLNTAIAGAAQVTLTWTAPASNGGSPITGYNLYRGTSSGGEVLVVTGIVSSPYTNTGLTNGQIYYYEVAALNSQGVGAMSTEQSATPFTVPGAPTGLVATPGNAQVVLTWVAPASNGGSAIAGYNVYRSLTTSTETLLINLAVALTYTDSGLTNGQMYFYKVTAVNVAGTGPLSTEASTTPLAGGMPGSPTGFSVTPGNAQVVLTWLVPSSNGGSPITGYHLYQGTTSGGEFLLVTIGNITTYTNVGLTNGQIYYYEVAAVNSQGVGAMSMEQSATPFTVPGAPTGLAAAPGNSQVVLTWVAPASNGGSLIFNYQVFQGTTSGGETWLANASTGLNYTSVGLINGQTYYFKIVAINCAGSGAFSTEVSAIPIGSCTIPSEPQSVTANAGNMQIVLNWVAPSSNGGSLIMSYWIFRWNVSEIVSSVSIPGNETSYIDSGLTNGVTYYYKIAAINSIGFGPNSTIVSATPSNGSIQLYPALSILFSLHGNVFYNPIHLTINITYGDWPVRQAWCVVDNMTLYNLSRINGTSTWGIYGVDVNLIAGSHALVFFVKDTGNHTISQSMTITVIVVTTVSNNSTTIMVIVIIVLGMSVGVALPLSYSRYRQRINQKKQVTSKASTKAKQISGMVGELSQDLDKKAKLLKTSMPVASTIQPYLRAKVAQRCALHKGLIVGPSYECKHCGAWYCLGCAYQLLEIDEKCFNCGAPIDAGSVVAASQQDMHPGKRLGISTLIDPEIIDKVRDLALSDEVEQDVLRMLRDIPPEQRFRYLEDTFDEKVPDDEDPF